MTDARYYGSSGSNAIEINANSVGLVSGTSGRQIHALFATQTLANAGDSLDVSFSFLTPATVSAGTDDLRIGLFDHLGRGDVGGVLDQDTSYSSGSPNADYNGLFGYMFELDVESADPATDFDIRRSDPSTSGRLLSTTSGFSGLPGSSGPDVGYVIEADTSYTVDITLERNLADGLDITIAFLGSSLTLTDDAPGSFDFGMIGLGASTNAFGTANSAGDPDNGIDITNVTVDFNPVPEPSTALLGLAGGLLMLKRRK